MSEPVRVRFCPSPTGNPHVGLIRTCLFNWAYARHVGGTFVFRVEDTDAARDSSESYQQLLDALRWLGLDWDEGPEVGGPYGPYRQSERRDIYRDVVGQLRAAGHLYESFTTAEETEARHRAAGRDPKLGYDNYDRDAHRRAARAPTGPRAGSRCCGCGCPTTTSRWTDLVRGEVTFAAGNVSDFVVVRANGDPLYTLVNPVDDALMRITHVLRGEDLLPSTPRQIALYRALIDIGVTDFGAAVRAPALRHGRGQQEAVQARPAVLAQRLPRGRLPARGAAELPRPARLVDRRRPRRLLDGRDGRRVRRRRRQRQPGALRPEEVRGHQRDPHPAARAGRLRRPARRAGARRRPAAPTRTCSPRPRRWSRSGCRPWARASSMLRFLLVPEAEFAVDEAAAAKQLGEDGRPVLAAALDALEALPTGRPRPSRTR